jgi:hypothetical protein
MVIRFPRLRLAKPSRADRVETHRSGLNRTDTPPLSRREIEHRERMLQHLALIERPRSIS